jgi:muramidase (phage lysozyme)
MANDQDAQLQADINRELATFGYLLPHTAQKQLNAATGAKDFAQVVRGAGQALEGLTDVVGQTVANAYTGNSAFKAFNDAVDGTSKIMDGMGGALIGMGGPIPVIVGLLLKVAAGTKDLAKVLSQQAEAEFSAFTQLSQFGASSVNGMEGVFQSAQKLGVSVTQLSEVFSNLAERSQDLALMGGTVNRGREQFEAMIDVLKPYRESLYNSGLKPSQQAEAGLEFLSLQTQYFRTQGINEKQLAQQFREYIVEEDKLTKLTGVSRKQRELIQRESLAEQRYAAMLQRLRAEGKGDEADRIVNYNKLLASTNPEAAKGMRAAIAGFVDTEAAQKFTRSTLGQGQQIIEAVRNNSITAIQATKQTNEAIVSTYDMMGVPLGKIGMNNQLFLSVEAARRARLTKEQGIEEGSRIVAEEMKRQGIDGAKASDALQKSVVNTTLALQNTMLDVQSVLQPMVKGTVDMMEDLTTGANTVAGKLKDALESMNIQIPTPPPVPTPTTGPAAAAPPVVAPAPAPRPAPAAPPPLPAPAPPPPAPAPAAPAPPPPAPTTAPAPAASTPAPVPSAESLPPIPNMQPPGGPEGIPPRPPANLTNLSNTGQRKSFKDLTTEEKAWLIVNNPLSPGDTPNYLRSEESFNALPLPKRLAFFKILDRSDIKQQIKELAQQIRKQGKLPTANELQQQNSTGQATATATTTATPTDIALDNEIAKIKDKNAEVKTQQYNVTKLLDLIGVAETVGGSGKYDSMVGGESNPKLLTMTVAQVQDFQKKRLEKGKKTAVGKYQISYDTLKDYLLNKGFSKDDVFNKQTQDQMAYTLLQRRGLDEFMVKLNQGKASDQDIDQFANALAKEWASLPTDKNQSFYPRPNKSTVQRNVFRRMIENLRPDVVGEAQPANNSKVQLATAPTNQKKSPFEIVLKNGSIPVEIVNTNKLVLAKPETDKDIRVNVGSEVTQSIASKLKAVSSEILAQQSNNTADDLSDEVANKLTQLAKYRQTANALNSRLLRVRMNS